MISTNSGERREKRPNSKGGGRGGTNQIEPPLKDKKTRRGSGLNSGNLDLVERIKGRGTAWGGGGWVYYLHEDRKEGVHKTSKSRVYSVIQPILHERREAVVHGEQNRGLKVDRVPPPLGSRVSKRGIGRKQERRGDQLFHRVTEFQTERKEGQVKKGKRKAVEFLLWLKFLAR